MSAIEDSSETILPATARPTKNEYNHGGSSPSLGSLTLNSAARPIRVLSVCETAKGGVGRFQESLRSVEASGFEVSVLLPEPDIDILTDKARLLSFPRSRRGIVALWSLVVHFIRARRSVRPDLYFFNSTFSLLPLAVLRLIGDRTPAVYCAHCWAISNYDHTSLKGRIVRALEGRLSGLADRVINVSKGDADLARRFGYRGRHVVIENAVPDSANATNSDARADDNGQGINLLFVGRFDRQKGLDILLQAFERARQAQPALRLKLVGGPVRGSASPDLPDGVTHLGWLNPEDLDDVYRKADALVVPSRWEGLPLIVPEALRNGTPVLLSDRSGMGSLVVEGESGLVFDLTEDALEQCLSSLSRSTLRAMRPAARQQYEDRYTIARFSKDLSRQLSELVGTP